MLVNADQFLAILIQDLFKLTEKSGTGIVIEFGRQRRICLFHASEVECLHTDRIMFLTELMCLLILPVAALMHDVPFQFRGTLLVFTPTMASSVKPFCCTMVTAKLFLCHLAITRITSVFTGIRDIQAVLCIIQTDHLFVAHRLLFCNRKRDRQHQINTIFGTIAVYLNLCIAQFCMIGKRTIASPKLILTDIFPPILPNA